jgi:predicted O-methyltransferase YrrM
MNLKSYKDMKGFFDYEDFYLFIVKNLANACSFVEVGSFEGKSASFLSDALFDKNKKAVLHTVDHFKHSDFETFCSNIKGRSNICIHQTNSVEASFRFAESSLDFVFLDAGHEQKDLEEDINSWMPKLKNGGVLSGHDFGHPKYKEMTEYIKSRFQKNLELFGKNKNVWFVNVTEKTKSL